MLRGMFILETLDARFPVWNCLMLLLPEFLGQKICRRLDLEIDEDLHHGIWVMRSRGIEIGRKRIWP